MTEKLRSYTLLSTTPEGRGCHLLRVSAEHAVIQYQIAGQYVQLAAPNVEASFFAISNQPSTTGDTVEFLIKASGPSASAITAVSANGSLWMSNAQGRGFTLHKEKDLLLLTMGTGISALRPLLQQVMSSRGEYKSVTLLHGVRTEGEAPFLREHELWRSHQIDVRPVFSRQEAPRKGRINEYIAEALSPGVVVYLSGSKEMMELIRRELAERQIGADRIVTNF